MRLVTLKSPNGPIAAVERDGQRFIITDTSGQPYRDIGDLLQRESDWQSVAEKAGEAASADWPLLRPVLDPGVVVCVGLNYRKHILEMGRELPSVPTYFGKFSRSLTDPEAIVPLPKASDMVDYEGELCVVIGAGGRDISEDRAWDAVAGLTLLNDVSMRDFQKRSIQFLAGKMWERSTPVGPAMVTADEFSDFAKAEVITKVNGEQRQRAPMSDLVFGVPQLIADMSQIITLRPGDLIATGTPGGVGTAMKPPSYLKPGDVVEISMDPIGVLRNRFDRVS
ncbi:MAG: fumarylacetoacetate hydrolase family protein [Candidatus Zixiibacteriota bacterium]